MGYTHYWKIAKNSEEFPDAAIQILKPILEKAHKDGIIQLEDDNDRAPICSHTAICFNGVGDNGHETFRIVPNDTKFDFCKTARKPYDEIVMKVLLILGYFIPELEVSSDGSFDEEWKEARAWFTEKIGKYTYIEEHLTYSRS